MLERTAPDAVVVTVDSALYPDDVVFKAFYWYGDDYDIDVTSVPGWISVALRRREGEISDVLFGALGSRIRQDLIDFRTRAVVARETQTIRELLVAKAFASGDDLDSVPPGSPADPVGFTLADWD